jgi:hypothetical protein
MKANTSVSKIMTASLITILAKLGGIFKVSLIFGSFAAFFTASSMLLPLSGAFGGILGSITFLVIGAMIRILTGSVLSFKILAYHIPGFFASAYWARPTKYLSIILPIVCMALFIAHPVGRLAAPYALYWLIPVVIALFRNKTVFLHSLSSTFIAHAVGSVIWLYATPMTPAFWYALIPVVAVERLVMAIGMTAAYHGIAKACSRLFSSNIFQLSQLGGSFTIFCSPKK